MSKRQWEDVQVTVLDGRLPQQRLFRLLVLISMVALAAVVYLLLGKDIAVLKIDSSAEEELLHPIPVGTSTGLRVGQNVMAIGNPFGLDHTLTAGVISGTGREVKSPIGRPITNVIQTDAAINHGKLDTYKRIWRSLNEF